jgi:hypothetical protein
VQARPPVDGGGKAVAATTRNASGANSILRRQLQAFRKLQIE